MSSGTSTMSYEASSKTWATGYFTGIGGIDR